MESLKTTWRVFSHLARRHAEQHEVAERGESGGVGVALVRVVAPADRGYHSDGQVGRRRVEHLACESSGERRRRDNRVHRGRAARALTLQPKFLVRLGGKNGHEMRRQAHLAFDAIFDQSQLTSFLATNHAYTHIKIRDSIAHVTTACILSGVQQLVDFSTNQFLRGHHQGPIHVG